MGCFWVRTRSRPSDQIRPRAQAARSGLSVTFVDPLIQGPGHPTPPDQFLQK